jgi:acetyl esterase
MAPLDPILAALLSVPPDPNAIPISAQPIETVRADTRDGLATIDKPGPAMRRVEEEMVPVQGGSIRARIYWPHSAPSAAAPGLVYFHGGGWVQCDLDTHDSLLRALADQSGVVVASIDYRMAPEHKFPVPFDDALAATRWVAANAQRLGIDPARLAVGGDSAGGNLAAAVTQALRDAGGPALRFQLLLYPVTDLASEHESRRLYGHGYWLDNMPFYTDAYIRRSDDRLDPRASPLRARSLAGLPAALVVTAEYDPLRDEGRAYADALGAAGVPVEYVCAPSMIHGFLSLHPILPAGARGVADCAARLRRGLGE